MTTYSEREFRARVSEIITNLRQGEDVIITRRGKPFGRLSLIEDPAGEKPSLETLKGSLAFLPEASYEDFQEIKAVWEPRVP